MWAPRIGNRMTSEGGQSRALTAANVRDCLATDWFRDWYDRYRTLLRQLEQSRFQSGDLLFDLVLQIGDEEERATRAEEQFARIDSSFEILAEYEACEEKASQAWIVQTQVESEIEEIRERISDTSARLRTREKLPSEGPLSAGFWSRNEQERKELGERLGRLEKEANERRNRHMQLIWRQEALWREVAETWAAAFRARMAGAEHRYRARRLRRLMQSLEAGETIPPTAAEPGVLDTAGLEADLAELAAEAERELGCFLITEFLYWPHQQESGVALCVPLVTERDLLNLQIEALGVYQVDRKTGIGFIEPLAATPIAAAQDFRLDAFFLFGRPTPPRRPVSAVKAA